MSASLELSPGVIDLWVARVSDWVETGHIDRLVDVLSGEEVARARKFAFDRDRDVYHLAHGMLRIVLSKYDDREPSDWRFVANRHGKPSIEGLNSHSLQFNISHTAGLAVIAITRDLEVGVDVESLLRTRVRIEVASKAFTHIESRAMTELKSEAERRDYFFQIWTLKESFIKAMGRGLSLPLDQFWFRKHENEFDFCVDAGLPENPADWQFLFVRDVPDYLIAVALRAGQQRFTLHFHQFRPDS